MTTNLKYHKNGQLKSIKKKNSKIYYNEQGQIVTTIKRREISKLKRIIKETIKGYLQYSDYEYTWINYNNDGTESIKYIIHKSRIDTYKAFDEIDDKPLEVYLYKKDKLILKIEWRYGASENELVHYQVYHFQNKKWIKGEKIEQAELFPTIERLQQELNNQ